MKKLELKIFRLEELWISCTLVIKKMSDQLNGLKGSKLKLQKILENLQSELLDTKDDLSLTNHKVIKKDVDHERQVEDLKNTIDQLQEQLKNGVVNPILPNSMEIKNEKKKENPEPITLNSSTSSSTQALEEQISQLMHLAKERLNTIQRYADERYEMIKDIEHLKAEATHLSDDVIIKSRPFQLLQHQFSFVSTELESSRLLVDKLNREITSLTSSHRTDKEKMEQSEKQRREVLEKSLKEMEHKVIKVRSDRDLHQKSDQKNSSASNQQTLSEFNLLLKTRENEVKDLKKLCERLKDEVQNLKLKQDDSKKDKLYDTIDQKNAEIKELQLKITNYSEVLNDYKERKRKAEQGKVDQYEKNQVSSNEKETEENSQSEIINIRKEMNAKVSKYERQIRDLTDALESQKEESEGLIGEIGGIEKGFEDLQQQNARLAGQLGEKEDSLTQLVSEQIKIKQLLSLLKDEKELLISKISATEDKCGKQEELNFKYDGKLKSQQDFIRKATDESRAHAALVEGLKRSARENSQSNSELKLQLEKYEKEIQGQRQRAEEKAVSAEKHKQQCHKLEEEISLLKRRVDQQPKKGGHSSTSDNLMEEELKHVKFRLRCSVCNDREKSAIILRCYHIFCRICIEKNLEVRSRKCPACGKSFAESDVRDIYL